MAGLDTQQLDAAVADLSNSLQNILSEALTQKDVRMQALVSIDFENEGDAGIYGKGLQWKGAEGGTKQLVYRANPDRVYSSESIDLHINHSFMIGNKPVLSAHKLGNAVRESNLQKVGTLQGLTVQGDLTIDDYIHYNSSNEGLGIGTDSPNGMLSVASLDAEFVVDTEPRAVRIGSFTTSDLNLITDNMTRISIQSNGNVTIGDSHNTTTVNGQFKVRADVNVGGDLTFQGKKFTSGDNPPTDGDFKQGDIMWNSNPVPTGYLGWVCVRDGTPGEWKAFSPINS